MPVSNLRGVVGQVQEETHVLHGPVLLKVLLEETRRLHVHLKDGKSVFKFYISMGDVRIHQ